MAGTDALVSIGADLSAMRRELSKMPNLVDAQAQKALIRFEKTTQKALAAAKKANKGIARANKKASKATTAHTKAMGDFQDAAGDADSTIMGLSGSLDISRLAWEMPPPSRETSAPGSSRLFGSSRAGTRF